MRSPITLTAIALVGLGVHPTASATYREGCTVKYETESGWSTGYQVQCNYTTGSELNMATTSFNYQPLSVYAVVFWQQHEASVIQMQGVFLCGFEATSGCVSSFMAIRGTDQQGRIWKVCAPSLMLC